MFKTFFKLVATHFTIFKTTFKLLATRYRMICCSLKNKKTEHRDMFKTAFTCLAKRCQMLGTFSRFGPRRPTAPSPARGIAWGGPCSRCVHLLSVCSDSATSTRINVWFLRPPAKLAKCLKIFKKLGQPLPHVQESLVTLAKHRDMLFLKFDEIRL